MSKLSRRTKILIAAATALALYTALGFLVLPRVLESSLVDIARESFGRELTLGRVRVNPYALSVSLLDGELEDSDGERLLGFDEVHANLQLSSIINFAVTLREVRLTGLYAHLRILQSGELSIADILEAPAEAEVEAAPADDDAGIFPVIVHHAEIERGQIVFSDFSRPTPFTESITPINVAIDDFSTRRGVAAPYSFSASFGAGESIHWEGQLGIDPPRSEGRLELGGIQLRGGWRYLQDDLRLEIRRGLANVSANYRIELSDDALALEIDRGVFDLRDLEILEASSGEPVFSLPSFAVADISYDHAARAARIGSVTSKGAHLRLRRESDGSLRESRVFAQAAAPAGPAASATTANAVPATPPAPAKAGGAPAPDSSDAAGDLRIDIASFALDDGAITFEDQTPSNDLELGVSPLSLHVTGFSTEPGTRVNVDFAAGIGDGRIAASGPVLLDPLEADLEVEVDAIELAALQPYLDDRIRLDLPSGKARLKGNVALRAQPGDGPLLHYEGGVGVDTLRLVDEDQGRDFLRWASLDLLDVVADVEPTRIAVREIVVREPYALVIIGPEGEINATRVFSAPAGAPQTPVTAASPTPAASDAGEPLELEISGIRVEDGSAQFTDLSLPRSFSTGIYALEGSITGLSSDARSRAKVDLKGRVDRTAPVEIAGEVNLLSAEAYTDLSLAFHNIEMTSFTPYSGKFAGMQIEKGKLSLNLAYRLDERRLVGENVVFLDQFTLGEAVDSPSATTLPVRLAVALLKNPRGEIHIDLPVRGHLDDPEFSLGRVILGAFVNLITKAVTSPFSLVAGLVGGDGDSMSYVAFDGGHATLDTDETKKLDLLAKALAERPALSLEIAGAAETARDSAGLRELDLAEKLQLAHSGGRAPAAPAVLEPDERSRLLRALYRKSFGERPDALLARRPAVSSDATPDVAAGGAEAAEAAERAEREWLDAAVEQRLLESIEVDARTLRDLAAQRGASIRDALIERGIAAERIFLLDVDVATDTDTPDTPAAQSSESAAASEPAGSTAVPSPAKASDTGGVRTPLSLTGH